MACGYEYEPVRTREDIINEERDENFEKLEQELASGVARLVTDPFTGKTTIRDAFGNMTEGFQFLLDSGMTDMCILGGLDQRNTAEWQLAKGAAGMRQKDFATMHGHSHSHGGHGHGSGSGGFGGGGFDFGF